MSYVPHSDADIRAMLATIGAKSLDDLFADIAPALRSPDLTLVPPERSEWDTVRLVSGLAGKNMPLACFAGAGVYDHWIPATVDHMLRRS
jgi:glycine dehydrogenase subunit 1